MSKPIIGMVHLSALPGAPAFGGSIEMMRDRALADAMALAEGGVDGVMIENFNDVPFFPREVPPWVIAHMTRIAAAIRKAVKLPLGINVLRNDALAALAVAQAAEADFIRVNVLSGARVTDQGIVEGQAHELLRARQLIGAASIRIVADVQVKHSSSLGPPRPLRDEVADLLERAGADAVIVSGGGTGQPADRTDLVQAKQAAGDAPVWVGSGATAETVSRLLDVADGVIVGSCLKVGGQLDAPVDVERVRAFVAAATKAS